MIPEKATCIWFSRRANLIAYKIGFTRQIWHTGDMPGACQIVEAKDESEVREKLATLPLEKAAMLDFEIIPLKPYAGFISS